MALIGPIEDTHTASEIVVNKIKTMLLLPNNPSAHLLEGRLPINVNFHGSITYKEGKPSVTAPAFFKGTRNFLAGQQVSGALAFPYGTGAFGGARFATYAPSLAQALAEQLGLAVRLDLSGHSRGGIVLGGQALSQDGTRAVVAQYSSAQRFLDPVMDKVFLKNILWCIDQGCPVGIIWGHSRQFPQKPIIEALVAKLRERFGSEVEAAEYGESDLDVAVPGRGIIVLKMNEGTPWTTHQNIKGGLPFLVARARIGGAIGVA